MLLALKVSKYVDVRELSMTIVVLTYIIIGIPLHANDYVLIIIILSIVPLTPTGFNITEDYFTVMDNTVMLEWDSPGGSGPEAIVDNYTITVNPMSVSHPISNVVLSSPWNVTLSYNVIYTATITAVNCAGESNNLTLVDIEYSKSLLTLK